jgi:hypothetical protein
MSSADLVRSTQPLIARTTFGHTEAWWAAVVSARLVDARAAFELRREGVDLGRRPLPRLLEAVAAAAPELALLASYGAGGGAVSVLAGAGGGRTVLLEADDGSVDVAAWAPDPAAARALARAVARLLPEPEADAGAVPVSFWRFEGPADGVQVDVRDLACPAFEAVAANYVPRVRAELERLARVDRPDAAGKIVLWHGPPGTGKTHAVRALARAWSERLGVSAEVVIDPEQLFASSSYLHELLLSDHHADPARRAGRRARGGDDDEDDQGAPAGAPLRLVILEDAAELFSTGCRSTQGFARLLNLTDGILGQGRRLVFLLTTNEPLGQIDPALTRAGRCVQALEFEPFGAPAAAAWLADRGLAGAPPAERTLSDLFAALASAPPPVASAPGRLGF